jgi:hypothetical protein
MQLPRFGYPGHHASFIQIASSIERLKQAVRLTFGFA